MRARIVSLRAKRVDSGESWSDDAVAHACGSGDPLAVAELFERYQLVTLRYLSRAANRADVEDLVQATFLQIARGSARFDGRSAVRTWLLGVATNVLRHHYRTTARRRRLVCALSYHESSTVAGDVASQISARRDIEGIRQALRDMSENTRLAFLLCEVEGLSAKEAAVVLRTSETAVWKRVSDARRRLLQAAEELRS